MCMCMCMCLGRQLHYALTCFVLTVCLALLFLLLMLLLMLREGRAAQATREGPGRYVAAESYEAPISTQNEGTPLQPWLQ